jgi:hypothetical protein
MADQASPVEVLPSGVVRVTDFNNQAVRLPVHSSDIGLSLTFKEANFYLSLSTQTAQHLRSVILKYAQDKGHKLICSLTRDGFLSLSRNGHIIGEENLTMQLSATKITIHAHLPKDRDGFLEKIPVDNGRESLYLRPQVETIPLCSHFVRQNLPEIQRAFKAGGGDLHDLDELNRRRDKALQKAVEKMLERAKEIIDLYCQRHQLLLVRSDSPSAPAP